MPNFKLGKMTIRSLFKKPETIMYPLESPEPYAAMRGHVDVEPQKCVLCSICQRVCPTDSIVVDKKGASWTINWFSCVICGECVRACPHDALDMHTARLEAAQQKFLHPVAVEVESPEEKAERERKKKERVAAALAAKAKEAEGEGGK